MKIHILDNSQEELLSFEQIMYQEGVYECKDRTYLFFIQGGKDSNTCVLLNKSGEFNFIPLPALNVWCNDKFRKFSGRIIIDV